MSVYDPATYDIRTAVPPMVGRVRTAFIEALEERLAPFELKAVDYLVLVSLANDVGDTASSICSVLSHDPGAMTRKIDGLEQRGLVRRVRSASDRRAIKIEITLEGRKLHAKALAVGVGLANDFLHGFTKAEVRTLETMLARIYANAQTIAAAEGLRKAG